MLFSDYARPLRCMQTLFRRKAQDVESVCCRPNKLGPVAILAQAHVLFGADCQKRFFQDSKRLQPARRSDVVVCITQYRSNSAASCPQGILLNIAPFQPKVPWPISTVPSVPSRSRTLSLIVDPALVMSQAFR